MHTFSSPALGLTSIRAARDLELVSDYEKELVACGYHGVVARLHVHSVAHFLVWLSLAGSGLELADPDDDVVVAFDRHRSTCECPGTSRNRGRHVVSCVRVFLRSMRKRGVIRTAAVAAAPDPLVDRFCRWLRADRGVVERTVSSYRKYVSGLVTHLGDDPGTYTARGLRDFVTRRYRHYGRHSIRMVLAAIRMFLRHLATEGRCRPGLEHALVSPANWSQEALPRGLSSEQVEQVLRACPLTRAGVRDRAILLWVRLPYDTEVSVT